jgi:hypothetical protein
MIFSFAKTRGNHKRNAGLSNFMSGFLRSSEKLPEKQHDVSFYSTVLLLR